MDKYDKVTRSRIMSSIHGKWTRHERMLHGVLKSRKIKHRMHPRMEGNPDAVLKDSKTAIFIDGCFWHGCKRCYQEPQTNRDYWITKIISNRKRDRKHTRLLRGMGYDVIRIWEHDEK